MLVCFFTLTSNRFSIVSKRLFFFLKTSFKVWGSEVPGRSAMYAGVGQQDLGAWGWEGQGKVENYEPEFESIECLRE